MQQVRQALRRSQARTLSRCTAVAAAALLAACSASPSSSSAGGGASSTGGSAHSQLLAFSRCMRSQGVPNFPDPEPSQTNAKFPGAQQLGVSSSLYQTAENACQHLLPSGSGSSQARIQQDLAGLRSFAQCMRGHGVPNWPDPTIGSQGKPSFDLTGLHGVDSPQATAAIRQCGHLAPSQLGGIPVEQ